MNKLLSPGRGRLAIQICAASAMAALLSGCSSDAMRFNDPFENPFSTGSIEKPKHVAASKPLGTGRAPPVMSQALPPRPVTSAALPPRPEAPHFSSDTTGSIAPAHPVSGSSVAGWSANGGPSIVMAQGETAAILAERYGVPEHVLLEINGFRSAGDLQPGARLTVPIFNARATAGNAASVVAIRAAPPATARVVAARPEKVEPIRAARAEPARAAKAEPVRLAKAEPHVLKLPSGKPVVAAPARLAVVAPAPGRLVKGAAAVRTATLEPAKAPPAAIRPVAPPKAPEAIQPKAIDPAPTASVPPAAASPEGNPEFRWPARGRIIQGFKGGSGGNDGINIAVPEGTPVKAAEGGVVAYAGSELKGYGNMILIRHPNGFVSAYANNGEIEVRKGETVKRGQLIAKSGQSGNVTSPQLHFELRKGATPVDPTSYLAGL